MTVYYHWGKQKPFPRPYKDRSIVVFLTRIPESVYNCHGKEGNLYAFDIPPSIEKLRKPHWYDLAQQIVVTDEDWPKIKFLGKVSEKKIKRMLSHQFYKESHDCYARFTPADIDVDKPYTRNLPYRLTIYEGWMLQVEKLETKLTKMLPGLQEAIEKEIQNPHSTRKNFTKEYTVPTKLHRFMQGFCKIPHTIEILEQLIKYKAIKTKRIHKKTNKLIKLMIEHLDDKKLLSFLAGTICDTKRSIKDFIRWYRRD